MISTKVRRVLMILCVLVLAVCAIWILQDRNAIVRQEVNDQEVLQLKPGGAGKLPFFAFPFISVACAEEEIPETPDIAEDFEPLLQVNQHAIAWLTAGERIDEPVVQYDNEFYLSHDLYGAKDSNGVVFVNEANSVWPRDKVLLIHGHNMRNKGRFGTLKEFADYNYVRQHPLVTFRTIYDEEDVYYVPVSGFSASMIAGEREYFDILRVGFETEEECTAYLEEISNRSFWKSAVDCNNDDDLIMLITCEYQHEEGRFILICRKLREEETPDSIRELFAQ